MKNLKVKLLGAVPTLRATDPKAYALYLQARQAQTGPLADLSRRSLTDPF
ncbi:hypothetical protein [Rhodanobacter sp. BL-MT-08]